MVWVFKTGSLAVVANIINGLFSSGFSPVGLSNYLWCT